MGAEFEGIIIRNVNVGIEFEGMIIRMCNPNNERRCNPRNIRVLYNEKERIYKSMFVGSMFGFRFAMFTKRDNIDECCGQDRSDVIV